MALYWIQVPLACTCTGYLVYLEELRPLLSNRQINNSLTRFNVRVIKLADQLADSGEQLIKRCRSKLLCFDYKHYIKCLNKDFKPFKPHVGRHCHRCIYNCEKLYCTRRDSNLGPLVYERGFPPAESVSSDLFVQTPVTIGSNYSEAK